MLLPTHATSLTLLQQYNTDKSEKDESQKHLSKWGEEDWQTKEGSANAKQDDGTEKRYLPKKAWDNMTEEEKEETDEKKLAESKQGRQFVGNTDKAREEGRKAREGGNDDEEEEEEEEDEGEDVGDEEQQDHKDEDEETQNNTTDKKSDSKAQSGEKRTRKGEDDTKPNSSKKQKSNSGAAKKQPTNNNNSNNNSNSKSATSKEATGSAGSSDRLPKKGQKVQWHSLPGYITGEVLDIVYEEKEVEGKKVKGGKDDPRIVLRSEGSGKVAVHKPEAVFFE